MKPCERGLVEGVHAEEGQEEADRNPEYEKELFSQTSTGIDFDKYSEIQAEATGNNVPQPIETFERANFHKLLMENIRFAKYKNPTPVQRYGIAISLAGRDLMACAQTGSGKTAAFLFPVISNLLIQIKKGCHILVATPGRLNQMIERRHLSLSKAHFLILDEADRMLDMGFEPQIRQIVDGTDLPKTGVRQTMMFSATFPREVQVLASEFLNDYIFLTVGRVGAASSTIQQMVEYVEETDKHEKLLEHLGKNKNGLSLVFVQTKKQSDTLEEFLKRQGFPATSLNGDRQQWEREEALENFRKGITPVLVATDVAQRGLDIPNVNHVINFDMPASIDDYVHRIGRTGRVGNRGLATSFFNDQDTNLAADLVVVLEEAHQVVPPWLNECAKEVLGGANFRTRYKFASRDIRGGGGGGGPRGPKNTSFDQGSSFDQGESVPSSNGGDVW